jgi:hypothetical protein
MALKMLDSNEPTHTGPFVRELGEQFGDGLA